MGQKISPTSIRLPLTKDWQSKWFDSTKNYTAKIIEDIKIRDFISKNFGANFAIAKIVLKRGRNDLVIDIHTARPGLLIGRQGKGVEEIRKKIEKVVVQNQTTIKSKIKINIIEVKKPDSRAMIVAQNIGQQISKRMHYRRVIKMAITKAMEAGAKGIKIVISGRLGGAEISRTENFNQGTIPTSTFKKDIDYAFYPAQTTYGVIGIKVWIFVGRKTEEIYESGE